jgi:hypothetical protein
LEPLAKLGDKMQGNRIIIVFRAQRGIKTAKNPNEELVGVHQRNESKGERLKMSFSWWKKRKLHLFIVKKYYRHLSQKLHNAVALG